MIDEKKVDEWAKKYANVYSSEYPEVYSFHDGFVKGIEWYKQSLWHDASEKPTRYDTYLVRTKQGCLDFCHFATEQWHSKDIGTVEKWLDLSDIKPKGGEW